MSEQESQQNSPNRLRQRLLGALVIVALAVLILPPWMDGGGLKTPAVLPVPPAPVVEHPAKVTVPEPSPAQQSALRNPPASFLSDKEPVPASSRAAEPDAAGEAASTGQGGASEASQESAVPPVSSPAVEAQRDTHPTPAPSMVEQQPPKAPIKSTAPSPPETAAGDASIDRPAPAKSGKGEEWVVQLGSFSDELNARGLAKSVTDAGFKVAIYPLFAKKGTVWRVRVGPFPTRDQAVKTTIQLRERLGRDGLVMPK